MTSRREFLVAAGAAAAVASGFVISVRPAAATPEAMKYAIRKVVGTSKVTPGRVKLDSGPEVAGETRGLKPGEGCAAVVRPEKLRVDLAGDSASATDLPHVEGVVESSIYLGTATQIIVGIGPEVRMTVLVPNADEAERHRAIECAGAG